MSTIFIIIRTADAVGSLGYVHKTVNHGEGEYARDEDGDGFYEVHCNTQEGICGAARAVIDA